MFLKRTLLLCLVVTTVTTAHAEDCASIFEHTHDGSNGKTNTVVADENAYYGYENCESTFKDDAELVDEKGKEKKRVLGYRIKTRNFSKRQRQKILAALVKLKKAINSDAFRKRVLAHRFAGKQTYANNNGLTNQQIYNKIMAGAEKYFPKKDYEMDLDVTMYYEDTSVIGYTYPNTTRIWVNSKFFNKFSHSSIAGNLTHEWLHKIGFGHDFEATARRPYSVPYAVGNILRSLIR